MQGLWVDFHKARGLFDKILDCELICKKIRVLFIKMYGLRVDFCKIERLFCKIYIRSNGLDLFAGRSDGSSFLDDVARPGGKNRPAFRSLEDMYQST